MSNQEWIDKASQIHELVGRIHPSSRSQVSSIDLQQLQVSLSDLAVALRDESLRIPLGRTNLPRSLAYLLGDSLSSPNIASSGANSAEQCELLQQIGRVAANLVVDCDVNRDIMISEGYLDHLLAGFKLTLSLSGGLQLPLSTLKALVASLLNLAVDGHRPTLSTLSSEEFIGVLLRISGRMVSGTGEEESDRTMIAQWLWKVISIVAIDESFNVVPNDDMLANAILPLRWFMPKEHFHSSEPDTYSTYLEILVHVCETVEAFTKNPEAAVNAFLHSTPPLHEESAEKTTPLYQLITFLQDGIAPAGWSYSISSELAKDTEDPEDSAGQEEEDHDLTLEECNKTIGQAKVCIVRAVVALSSDLGDTNRVSWFWEKMRIWIDLVDTRSDLTGCALLCFGNRAREDNAARNLLPDLLPVFATLMKPTSPVTVQHAVIGLLRNLSIPQTNKEILGEAGLLDHVVQMGVWKQEKDMVGSVQGGAIALVKSLCNSNASNSKRFISNEIAITQILGLMRRTDDSAVRCEATRIFCNAIRSLARQPESLGRLCEKDIIGWISEMLRTGIKYQVLVNEAIVALALLVTFQNGESKSNVISALLRAPNGIESAAIDEELEERKSGHRIGSGPGNEEGEKEEEGEEDDQSQIPPQTALDVIVNILSPSSSTTAVEGEPVLGIQTSPEIRGNALTLLRQITSSVGDEESESDLTLQVKAKILASVKREDVHPGNAQGLEELLSHW